MIKIAILIPLKDTILGLKTRWKELCNNSNPTIIIIRETISAATYSVRPCPKGCSLSAGFFDSLNPKSVIALEPTSDRLLTLSATNDILLIPSPITNLMENKMILVITPTILAKYPYFVLI